MNALILVDLQNDFVEGGALAVAGGSSVIEVANQAMAGFDHVIATQDWHPPNHGSFASQHAGVEIGDLFELAGQPQVAWPDHCIQGTVGAEFLATLDQSKIEQVIQKGTDANIDSYSGFFDNGRRKETPLHSLLQSLGVNEVHVMGLATDYCVKFTALDAVDLGYRTYLVAGGCRGVNLQVGDVDQAIEDMQQAGILIA